MKLQLISFKLCPFVQRAVIMLREKGVEFDITYIDLKRPPDWFKAISPFGKVPVLKVDDTALFESTVIMEFLDETHPPSMHPADPLRRAHNRAWMEFSSNLNGELHHLMVEKDAEKWTAKLTQTRDEFAQVENELGDGPLFNGAAFSLIDAAFAPALMRARYLNQHAGLDLFARAPKVRAWAEALLARDSVRHSVVPEFEELFLELLRVENGHINTLKRDPEA